MNQEPTGTEDGGQMKVIIIGNGVAGATCAMTLRELDPSVEITLVGRESKYFFARTGLMYALMDRLTVRDLEPFERDVYQKKRINLISDEVLKIDFDRRRVDLLQGEGLPYDRLVLATGSLPVSPPKSWLVSEDGHQSSRVPNDRPTGMVNFVSLGDLQACESLLSTSRRAVVVGGGLIGIELVESLLHHGLQVTFLIRETRFWPDVLSESESDLVFAHMKENGVDVRFGDSIESILRDAHGRVSGVETILGDSLPCEILGVCIGVKPNVRLF